MGMNGGSSFGKRLERPAPESAGEKRFTVLIVDDQNVNQRVLHALLAPCQCAFIFASNGEEAVNAHSLRKPDLILMDIDMPLMNGLEATHAIRKVESGGVATPIIAVTGHIDPAEQHICIAAGMNDYIAKPAKLGELKRALSIWAPALRFPEDAAPRRRRARSVSLA